MENTHMVFKTNIIKDKLNAATDDYHRTRLKERLANL